jgi:hypothetical protein
MADVPNCCSIPACADATQLQPFDVRADALRSGSTVSLRSEAPRGMTAISQVSPVIAVAAAVDPIHTVQRRSREWLLRAIPDVPINRLESISSAVTSGKTGAVQSLVDKGQGRRQAGASSTHEPPPK